MNTEKVVVVCDNKNIKAATVCEVLKRKRGKVLCRPPYGKDQWYLERQTVILP